MEESGVARQNFSKVLRAENVVPQCMYYSNLVHLLSGRSSHFGAVFSLCFSRLMDNAKEPTIRFHGRLGSCGGVSFYKAAKNSAPRETRTFQFFIKFLTGVLNDRVTFIPEKSTQDFQHFWTVATLERPFSF